MDDGVAAMRVIDAIARSGQTARSVAVARARGAVMRLGIFAKTFRAAAWRRRSTPSPPRPRQVQFNMALAGGPPLPADTAGRRRRPRAVAARGLSMAAVSGTYNMAHPDPAVRADGAARLAR